VDGAVISIPPTTTHTHTHTHTHTNQDVICGFPGETEEDFAQTLALIEEYAFPVVNISQVRRSD
jgi:tRNA A37 methylthiotransferase MiaB